MRRFIFLTTLLAAVTSVAAHGFPLTASSGGKTEILWNPWRDPWVNPVPILVGRKIPGNGPVRDPSSPDIACNVGGEDGTGKLFEVNAGSSVTLQWNTWPTSHLGPITTLMASCNGDCSNFKASDAKWFKIDESGYKNGKWGTEIFMANGNKSTSTIPIGLASGQYLYRYENVALHNATEPQYYPGCIQVNVINGGTGEPSSSDLTSLPGMYDGFKWPDIWTDSLDGFVVAGPKVVSFAGGDSSDPSSAPSPSSVSSSSVPSYSHSPSTSPRPQSTGSPTNPTSTPANPTSTGTCKSKKSDRQPLPTHRPRWRSTRH